MIVFILDFLLVFTGPGEGTSGRKEKRRGEKSQSCIARLGTLIFRTLGTPLICACDLSCLVQDVFVVCAISVPAIQGGFKGIPREIEELEDQDHSRQSMQLWRGDTLCSATSNDLPGSDSSETENEQMPSLDAVIRADEA